MLVVTGAVAGSFPFTAYFLTAPQPIFKKQSAAQDLEIARGCFRHINRSATARPFAITFRVSVHAQGDATGAVWCFALRHVCLTARRDSRCNDAGSSKSWRTTGRSSS